MFRFSIEELGFEWNGAHTVNVFMGEDNIDVFSLGYGRDDWTREEVMSAALDWATYSEIGA